MTERRTDQRRDDSDVLADLADYRAEPTRAKRNRIVEDHQWLGELCARQVRRGEEPLDDLVQVAMVGILKAVERFDPAFGVPFRAYASVTARGEIRRHYRDHTWSVRVPRPVKDLAQRMRTEQDAEARGGSPTTAELAASLGVTVAEVLEAERAARGQRTKALAFTDSEDGASCLRTEDPGFERHLMRAEVADLLTRLPARQRLILYLRFFHDMTQSEIGQELSLSQVQVSRLLRAALATLRTCSETLASA